MKHEIIPEVIVCPVCSIKFNSFHRSRVYCSTECGVEHRRQKRYGSFRRKLRARGVHSSLDYPSGHYVYGWHQPGGDLPFYIGKGFGNRAWEKHKIGFCRYFRDANTIIKVYRDNLTEEGAFLIESVLTSVFESMGAFLTHQVEPLKRQECGPLEL